MPLSKESLSLLLFLELRKKRLLLFILLFLVGGGIGQVIFFTLTWAVATRINKPLTWWRRVLPEAFRKMIAKLWPTSLVVGSALVLIALEIAISGYVPGMSDQDFTYQNFEDVREALITTIQSFLTKEDKRFIISLKKLEPDWNIYDFQKYPAIQWKLENIKKFKQKNYEGYNEALDRLMSFLIKLYK